MIDYAQAQFALTSRDEKTGKSRLQLFQEIAQQTGVVAPELNNLPPLPYETAHIWRWFNDIGRARTAGMNIDPITWSDAYAYFSLYGIRPAQWELEALRTVDDAFLLSRIEPTKRVAKGAGDLRRSLTGPHDQNAF